MNKLLTGILMLAGSATVFIIGTFWDRYHATTPTDTSTIELFPVEEIKSFTPAIPVETLTNRFFQPLINTKLFVKEADNNASHWSNFISVLDLYEDEANFNLYKLTGSKNKIVCLHSNGQRVVDLFNVILSKIVDTICIQKVWEKKSSTRNEAMRDYTFYFNEDDKEFAYFLKVYHKYADRNHRMIIVTMEEWRHVLKIISEMRNIDVTQTLIRRNKGLLQKHVFSANFFLLMKSLFKFSSEPLTEEEETAGISILSNSEDVEKIFYWVSIFYDIINDTACLENDECIETCLRFASFIFMYEFHVANLEDYSTLASDYLCCKEEDISVHSTQYFTLVPACSQNPVPVSSKYEILRKTFNDDVIVVAVKMIYDILQKDNSFVANFSLNGSEEVNITPPNEEEPNPGENDNPIPPKCLLFTNLVLHLRNRSAQNCMIGRFRMLIFKYDDEAFGYVRSKLS